LAMLIFLTGVCIRSLFAERYGGKKSILRRL
jgi:hypothetical protein